MLGLIFSLGEWYWLIVVLATLGGGWGIYRRWGAWWPGVLIFILLVIIGLALFGMPFSTTAK